jgi:hypothetical protein
VTKDSHLNHGHVVDPDDPQTLICNVPAKVVNEAKDEVRITDPKTGGQKGQKIYRFDLIPEAPQWELAKLYGVGANKYAERNWELGYKYSLSYAALRRHLSQFWKGEDYDTETGCHHLSSVIFHAMAMMEFQKTHPEMDDRPISKTEILKSGSEDCAKDA